MPWQKGESGNSHWQRDKTHCPHGHAYDVSNTYVDAQGRRFCRACRRERNRVSWATRYIARKRPCTECGRPTTRSLCLSCAKKGDRNLHWRGDAASASAGRNRTRRTYRSMAGLPCSDCTTRQGRDRHHHDGNPLNNRPDNILWLCRRCHQARHREPKSLR